MNMETAALLGMTLIAIFAFVSLGLAFWSVRHDEANSKNNISVH